MNMNGTSLDHRKLERNNINKSMALERALHKKCNQNSMAVAQRLISSMMRCCVDVCVV